MKKKTILLAVMSSLLSICIAYSQKAEIQVCKDKIDGSYRAYSNARFGVFSEDNKRGFRMMAMFKYEKERLSFPYLVVVSSGIGNCFEHDQLIVLFDDDSKVTFTSFNSFNCAGDSYFMVDKKKLQAINKKIKTVRFINGRSNDTFTEDVPDEMQDYFINVINDVNANIFTSDKCED